MKKFVTIRKQLAARHDEIEKRLEKISLERRHTNQPLNADFEEQAVEVENDQVLDALDSQIRLELKQIEKTLSRMDQGLYGKCEDCGENIAPKRLEALPFTTRCIACEENFQRQRLSA